MFHIHVDPITIDPDFRTTLVDELSFQRVGYEAPSHPGDTATEHFTLKTASKREFQRISRIVQRHLGAGVAVPRGYAEAEYVAMTSDVLDRTYVRHRLPFRLINRPLRTHEFRESELHVTLSLDESDERLLEDLREIGLLEGAIPKAWGTAKIFTVQGTRGQIGDIREPLMTFLQRSGGAARGKIKEERTIWHWASCWCCSGLPWVMENTRAPEGETPVCRQHG